MFRPNPDLQDLLLPARLLDLRHGADVPARRLRR